MRIFDTTRIRKNVRLFHFKLKGSGRTSKFTRRIRLDVWPNNRALPVWIGSDCNLLDVWPGRYDPGEQKCFSATSFPGLFPWRWEGRPSHLQGKGPWNEVGFSAAHDRKPRTNTMQWLDKVVTIFRKESIRISSYKWTKTLYRDYFHRLENFYTLVLNFF